MFIGSFVYNAKNTKVSCVLTQIRHILDLPSVFANNKCADQPAHPRRLISGFVIRDAESIISKLGTGKIFIEKLVYV